MIINDDILRRDAISLIRQIDRQIDEVNRQASHMGVEAYKLQDSHGNWPMIPLLSAKVQALSILVTLQKK